MEIEYKIVEEKHGWNDIISKFEKKDIFFEYEYFHLHSREGEKPILVYMRTDLGKMAYPFVLRDISYHSNFKGKIEKNKYFDISTPYGYSGHLIEAVNYDSKIHIIKLFYQKFADFCSDYNIVSEFIKFSPLLKTHEDMGHVMKTFSFKKMLVTNLQDYGDPLCNEVSKKRIKQAKKCKKLGMKTKVEFAPRSFDKQMDIYQESMEIKRASEFYIFSREYFEKMLKYFPQNNLLINVLFEEKIIAFAHYFIYGSFMYGHVAGTDINYRQCSPSTLYYVDAIDYGHKHGYKYHLLGGGLTTDEDDSLYQYKKSFANITYDLHLGTKIWDENIYNYLVCLMDSSINSESKFFPLYRSS